MRCDIEGCLEMVDIAQIKQHKYHKHEIIDGSKTIKLSGDFDTVHWVSPMVKCPVCSFEHHNEQIIKSHMVNKHPLTKIESEVYQQCGKCAVLLKKSTDMIKHWSTGYCKTRSKRRNEIIQQNEIEDENVWKICASNKSLERVHKVKYLGSYVTSDSKDFIAAKENLRRAKLRWQAIRKLSTHKNANTKIMKAIYLATVLPILLYCSETWTLTEKIKQMVEVFHHSVARELNRQKFLKFWTYRYGERVVDLNKVRQNNDLDLKHINMKTIGEYWEARTEKFAEIHEMTWEGNEDRTRWRTRIFW